MKKETEQVLNKEDLLEYTGDAVVQSGDFGNTYNYREMVVHMQIIQKCIKVKEREMCKQ